MNVVLAAVLLLTCETKDYDAETEILREAPVAFSRVDSAAAQRLRRPTKAIDLGSFDAYGYARVIAHAGERVEPKYGDWRVETLFLLEIRSGGRTEWWHLRESDYGHLLTAAGLDIHAGPVDRPRLPAVTLVDRRIPLIRFGSGHRWLAMGGSGSIELTFLIDLRSRPFRVVVIRCANTGATGVCGGPNHYFTPKRDLSCEWRSNVSDFRCVSRETMNLRWTKRIATRTFWLLRDRTIAPSRFDTATYRDGLRFAEAAHGRDAIRQRALIDGIGHVEPILEVSPNEVLFGASALEPAMSARFFLLQREPARWIEIPVTRLADEKYAARRSKQERDDPTTSGFTPEEPRVHFSAVELEPFVKRRQLIEVIATEGEGRALFWIVIDHAASPPATGAIRLATTEAEHRECEQHIRPPSATWLCVPDDGLPGFAQVMPSQIEWEPDQKTGQHSCWKSGSIDWKPPKGWVVEMREAPCTDPVRPPQAVTIGVNGELGIVPVEP